MATPHTALTHARTPLHPVLTAPRRRTHRLRSGVLLGATAALSLSLLPGTAVAAPGATSAQQAAQLAAQADHQLEVVTEQVNAARVALDKNKAAAARADKAAAAAKARLNALDGQIRQLARTAYTSDGLSQLDALMTSGSVDDFVSKLGTLDGIAGHTNAVVDKVAQAAQAAKGARAQANGARAQALRTLNQITAKQKDLQAKIAAYQRQYAALSAPQRTIVNRAAAGVPVAAPARAAAAPARVAAASGGAQTAVNTALAQVGDPYVWGAAGPNAFDCSGLMQYAWAAAGVALPHSSSAQSTMGVPVSRSALQPGDLVFFYSPVSHVGMYIGNGQMVHAATSGTPVQVVSLDSLGSYNSARRIG